MLQLISFGSEIIELSSKYPMVPGFYRLVSIVLRIVGEEMPEKYRPLYISYSAILIEQLASFGEDLLAATVQVSFDLFHFVFYSLKHNNLS